MHFIDIIKRRKRSQQQHTLIGEDTAGRESGRGVADGIVIALKVAKESTDWAPIAKGVLGGVSEIIDVCRVSVIN